MATPTHSRAACHRIQRNLILHPASCRLALGHKRLLRKHQPQHSGECSLYRTHGRCKGLLPHYAPCHYRCTGACLFHPTALSLVNRLCIRENRGRITSYFVVSGNFGYAIGPVLTGLLAFLLGLPGLLFLIFPALFMVLALRYLLPGGIAGACQPHSTPEFKNEGGDNPKNLS